MNTYPTGPEQFHASDRELVQHFRNVHLWQAVLLWCGISTKYFDEPHDPARFHPKQAEFDRRMGIVLSHMVSDPRLKPLEKPETETESWREDMTVTLSATPSIRRERERIGTRMEADPMNYVMDLKNFVTWANGTGIEPNGFDWLDLPFRIEQAGLRFSVERRKDDWVDPIEEAARALHEELGRQPKASQVWHRLMKSPPHGYYIAVEDDYLTMPGNAPLSRKDFEKRWAQYAR
jgi:hypothetical protein